MLKKIKRWYQGETKLVDFENDPNSFAVIMPRINTEYHWTAKVARLLIHFYFEHWKWIWTLIISLCGLVFKI
jgi:hypothetical protein